MRDHLKGAPLLLTSEEVRTYEKRIEMDKKLLKFIVIFTILFPLLYLIPLNPQMVNAYEHNHKIVVIYDLMSQIKEEKGNIDIVKQKYSKSSEQYALLLQVKCFKVKTRKKEKQYCVIPIDLKNKKADECPFSIKEGMYIYTDLKKICICRGEKK